MKAIEVKRKIDKKINQVANAIAFCYGRKYQNKILDTIDNLNYYIYDNDYYQTDRLIDIELFNIASQFAKDISDNLDVNEERKMQINNDLAIAIQCSSNLENYDEYLLKKLSSIEELKDNIDFYFDEMKKVINYYISDYEVKKINNIVSSANQMRLDFDTKCIETKRTILEKKFNIDKNLDKEEVLNLWELLESFNPSLRSYMNNCAEYREAIYDNQETFYRSLSCRGHSLEEVFASARIKGIHVDDRLFYECKNEYMEAFDKLVETYYFQYSNLDEIFADLDRKGYSYDKKAISTFIIESKNLCGVNFVCYDDMGREENFIVCNNNSRLYTREFNETFIHEIVHYIGGINYDYNKKGLCYNNDMRYLNLEEAYTNYLSKVISKKYSEEHGDLIESNNFETMNTAYDCTLPYIREVFKLYKDELMEIQMSDKISETKACSMCPFSEIADSVTKIKEAEKINIDTIIKEEILKLNRRR